MTKDEQVAISRALTALLAYVDMVCAESGALRTEGGGLVEDAACVAGVMVQEARRVLLESGA